VAQLEIFRLPVVDQGLVDLAQQIVLIGVDTVELPIGCFTNPPVRMPEIGGEFLPRHRLLLALDCEGKHEGVRHHVVQRMDCATACDVLDIDDFFFRLGQGVGLKPADRFEVIPERAGSGHEPQGILLIDALPPEVEKYQSVLKRREPLLDFGLKRTCCEVFRIF
jgi:hypothetical protein